MCSVGEKQILILGKVSLIFIGSLNSESDNNYYVIDEFVSCAWFIILAIMINTARIKIICIGIIVHKLTIQ